MPLTFVAQGPMLIPSGVDTTTGLKGLWLMNEGSGGVMHDTSGNGHDTDTIPSGALWGADYFDAQNGCTILVPDHADFVPGTAFTTFAWIKGAPQVNTFFFCQFDYTAIDASWLMQLANDGVGSKLRVSIMETANNLAGNQKDYTSSVAVADSTWHSVCMRWDNGTLDIFIDAVKDTAVTKTTDNSFTTAANATCKLSFSGILNNGSPQVPWGGFIKKYRFYQRALSDADIAAVHLL